MGLATLYYRCNRCSAKDYVITSTGVLFSPGREAYLIRNTPINWLVVREQGEATWYCPTCRRARSTTA